MASPTLAAPAPAKVAVAESSSTSVTVAEPILSAMDLMTLPVAGSFTTRTGRLTSTMSPTFRPAFLPTLTMSVVPETSATRPLTSSLTVGNLGGAGVELSAHVVDGFVGGFAEDGVAEVAAAHVDGAATTAATCRHLRQGARCRRGRIRRCR